MKLYCELTLWFYYEIQSIYALVLYSQDSIVADPTSVLNVETFAKTLDDVDRTKQIAK